MEKVDCIVIGAGVVGLAIARALAQRGLETVVIESEPAIGTGISSRNSEVVHAGIYYPPNSLKAQLCVRGRDLLYDYCEARGIAHARCGKFIVATSTQQIALLEDLHMAGRNNGVDGLEMLSGTHACKSEPQLSCVAALHSSSTGIVDSHAFMLSLQADCEAAGGVLAFASPVIAGSSSTNGITL
ncbi:L-2-hydroxyglutarate oxidase LhgO [Herbaspirillum sp. Sphag1AN]|nr:L-2-hydroxyglutarate oxidase LhgO [Herbaspirillum sp. Sphag1AN]MBB3247909.1 L-2-hydroxyglutarate oxidase LhgO [Herbaspirillum sp. Sphag64]